MTLAELKRDRTAVLVTIGGARSFRRRLMELGFVPGTPITLRKIAPLGDPMEFVVRGGSVSIRRRDAAEIMVEVIEAPGAAFLHASAVA
ncbi:MAG: ferrous iron transport protein A [Myxococcales bacterium]|nr:ferrous iron transport protein A [Myxococcales bacterium]